MIFAISGLQEKPGPWTIGFLRKTRFRDIFKNPTFWIFNDFPLTEALAKKEAKKKNVLYSNLYIIFCFWLILE